MMFGKIVVQFLRLVHRIAAPDRGVGNHVTEMLSSGGGGEESEIGCNGRERKRERGERGTTWERYAIGMVRWRWNVLRWKS